MFSKKEHLDEGKLIKKTFINPSVASILDRLIIHPLDAIMTFQQRDNIPSIKNTVSFIQKNYGVKGFYKGLSFPLIVSAIPMQLSLYGTYEGIKESLTQMGYSNMRLNEIFSSLVTGLLVSAVFTPVDAKRIRDTFNIQVKNPYNPLYFYRGFIPMTLKGITHVPIALAGADFLKDEMDILSHKIESSSLKKILSAENSYSSLISGILTGGAAQFITTPIDVVKTKFIADMADQTKTLWEHTKSAYEERVLFNSLGIRIVRLGLHTGIMIALIDALNKITCGEEDNSLSRRV